MRESRRLNLHKDEKEKIEGEINFRKWVNHHVEKIRKARSLIKSGVVLTKKILSPSFSSEKLPHPKPSNNRSILGLIKKSQSLNALQHPKPQKEKLPSFKDDSSKKGLVNEVPK